MNFSEMLRDQINADFKELMAVETAGTVAEQAGRFELPNGQRVFYDDASHRYYRCNPNGTRGRALSSVTGVTKTLDYDPSRLLVWAARTQMIGVAELAEMSAERDWLDSSESIWSALEAAGLTFEDVRDKAAKRGTNVHRLIFEALANGDPVSDLATLTEDERGAAEAVIRFWGAEQPEPILVEQIVYSESLGVAGRLDFYGRIKSREGPGVLDLKTGGFLGAAAHCQVGGGYPLLLEHSGWPAAEWAAMLQVNDGDWTLVDAEASTKDFETAVAAYRAAGRINRAAMNARRNRG